MKDGGRNLHEWHIHNAHIIELKGLIPDFSFIHTIKMKYTVPSFLGLIHVLFSIREGHGFSVVHQSTVLRQPTVLLAKQDGSMRRNVLDTIKRVFIGTGAALASQGIPVAFADDTAPVGKVVEIAVANLDGDPGKTGTIRIQMKPEWAPRGVARFEVSLADSETPPAYYHSLFVFFMSIGTSGKWLL
jgi:hypothetical protein